MYLTRPLLFVGLVLLSASALALEPGTVVIYSDNSVEKLLSDDGKTMTWEDGRKRRITRSHNPVEPVLQRQDFLGGGGYRLELVEGDPSPLVNAAKGTSARFVYLRTKNDGKVSQRIWQCTYAGERKRKVIGKKRTLRQYDCKRLIEGSKFWKTTTGEELRLRYSPELGLVVDQRRIRAKRTNRRKVVAILPPAKATYARIDRHLDQLQRKHKKSRK